MDGDRGYNGIVSGYHLYQATSLEAFPDDFPDLFLQDNPLSLSVDVVVQNAGLGEWLQRHLAGSQGTVMGMRLLMPEQALRNFAVGFPTARKLLGTAEGSGERNVSAGASRGLLFMDGMKVVVFKALEEILAGDDPIYEPLRAYAGSGGSRIWQLADVLAGIFYHYGMNCLPLVDAWDSGSSYSRLLPEDVPAEAWQRGLWTRIFHDDSPYTHLSRVLSETMSAGDTYDGPPSRVVLFGSMFLGETGLRFFRHLAGSLDVHHFVLSPSRVYGQGMDTDPAGQLFLPAADHLIPFLRENGRLSEGFASLIPSLAPDETIFLEKKDSEQASSPNTLDCLRHSLEFNEACKGPVKDDGSLEFHNLSGFRREVEVLKDRILEALRKDRSLAPTEIGVLAPDISRYAPYIETIFPSSDESGKRLRDSLPFNLTDLPVRGESPYPAGFGSLLALPGSRFGRSSLMDLFSNLCFSPVSRDTEITETWKRFTRDLNVRWGVDSKHRKDAGAADTRTGSWEMAFERILEGYCLEEGDNTAILPAVLEGDSEADEVGRLIYSLRSLDAELRHLEGERHSLRDWTLYWENLAERWLLPRKDNEEDEADRLRIKGAIRDLMALFDDLGELSDFSDNTLPWTAFSSLLEEMVSPTGGRRGRYLARGITCSSLKPMRAIPFRRIYVLGMDEGAWPGREYLTGFDLRDRVPKAIDLSREAVDRFAFLEVLFSAGEHLSFFYSGRDPERGESQSPAAPLVELQEHLGAGWKKLLRRHPLAPYNPSALTGSGPLASSSREALALAESRHRGPDVPVVAADSLPPLTEEDTVDWNDLYSFLVNPVRQFYRNRLGASPDYGVEELQDEDVLEAGFLDWWKWRNDAVMDSPESLSHPEALIAAFRRRLDLEGRVSRTPAGGLKAGEWAREADSMSAQMNRLESEGLRLTEPFSCLLDPLVTDTVLEDDGPEPGSLLRISAPLLSPSGARPLRIDGTIGGLRLLCDEAEGSSKVWTLLEFVSSARIRSSHNLRNWIIALILGTIPGEQRPEELRVYRLGSHDLGARRYYYREEDSPSSFQGEKRVLGNPAKTLGNLVKAFRDGESEALLLYPELADKLAAVNTRNPLEENLPLEAAGAWASIVGDRYASFSRLRDCSFRQRFVHEPDFRTEGFMMAWESLYRDGGIL